MNAIEYDDEFAVEYIMERMPHLDKFTILSVLEYEFEYMCAAGLIIRNEDELR